MNLIKTYIDRSNIEGIGLFVAEFIPKGTLIWRFTKNFDIEISKNKFENIKKELTKIELDYILRYSFDTENTIIFCTDDAKYCNHSYEANTGGIEKQIALKDINIREEITCNYKELNGDDWNEEEFKILKSYK